MDWTRIVAGAPLPLRAQAAIVFHLLPLDDWPKSLAFQQCVANRVIQACGPTVQSGPFRGMASLTDAADGCLIPKLIGRYEEELSPTFEAFFRQGFDRFIDVGCASGYWLTGVATRMPGITCYGFDTDPAAIDRAADLASRNGVRKRIQLRALCTHADLQDLISTRTLLLVDIEGAEYDLLDPDKAPSLRHANIVVECHDFIDDRITPALTERFADSHEIEVIESEPRTPFADLYPSLRALPKRYWDFALDERRPAPMTWMVMRPY